MAIATTVSHSLDIAYVQQHFALLESLCMTAKVDADAVRAEIARGDRPRAAYTLSDGTQWFPRDYFELETDRDRFLERMRVQAELLRTQFSDAEFAKFWEGYLSGIYAVCLKTVSPENIVRKNVLVRGIEQLANEPREGDPAWVEALKRAVDTLDQLERPFSPVFDREFFGRPPTRDSHITAMRDRFPAIRTLQ